MKAVMYHYVRPLDREFPFLRYLNLEDFSLQLEYFQDNFHVLDKAELLGSLESGQIVEDGMVLTFDDGISDHYRYVFPELVRRNLWGIFYIPTAPYTHGKIIDVHRIHLLLGKYGGVQVLKILDTIITEGMLTHEHVRAFREDTYIGQDNDEATSRVKRILNYFMAYEYREAVIDVLMEHFYGNESALLEAFYIAPEEIREMSKAGMLIGSHTVNHPVLSKLSSENQREEVQNSFAEVERLSGEKETRTFCYPYGGFHTFSTETETILENSNCLFSFNVEPRDIGKSDILERRQALPRYDCNIFPHGQCRV